MNDRVTIEEQLAAGHLALVRTRGTSMQPLLYEGESHVLVAPAPENVAVGELALARLPDGRYLLHRVIARDDAFYYTRGDHCYSQEAVPRDQVVGVAVELVRRGRRISMRGKIYRMYTHFWMGSYPARLIWVKARRRLGRWTQGRKP